MSNDLSNVLDAIEKKYHINTTSMTKDFHGISTGLLVTDLILSGGIRSGCWATFYGGEQSAKSTHTMKVLSSALNSNVPILMYWDYEGSFSVEYMENMLDKDIQATDIFGVRDAKGNWTVEPRVRYYSEDVGQTFFGAVAMLLRQLPDRVTIDGKRYLVYPNTKRGKALAGPNYIKSFYSKYNAFYIPAPDDLPDIAALIIVDSYPAMLPESRDDDDPSGGMAVAARMFSEEVPKVAGKLRKKGVTILGVNQLRLRPAVQWGNPEYEPMGEALKFFSSLRIKQTPRAIPHGKGQIEEEDTVLGESGTDKYRYIHLRATKNKLSTPFLEGWSRLWISDHQGNGRGFDPVWDCFEYLRQTGQCTGTMKKMTITLDDLHLEKIDWYTFKGLILLRGKDLKNWCSELGLKSNPKIQERCFKQVRSGKAMELYFAKLRGEENDE